MKIGCPEIYHFKKRTREIVMTLNSKKTMVDILCIHDIVPDKPDSPWEVHAAEFENLLYSLIEQNYRFCKLGSFYQEKERSIVLTFDDAPSGAINWIIERAAIFDIQAAIFPVINWLDFPPPRSAKYSYRALASWQDIKRAHNQGHIIGSHGMSHVPLHNLEENQIVYELMESKNRLESRLGSKINHFSAPFGKLSPLVIELAFEFGYASICSTITGSNTLEDISGSILKRFVIRSDFPNLGLPDDLIKK